MNKHFYSHLVSIESVKIELDSLDLSSHEKAHLIHLAHSNIHSIIVEAVLSELSEEDKKLFLTHVSFDDHERVWELLNKKVTNIEGKIKKASDDLIKQLHRDIRELKEKK